jgi:hypothetical protein
VFETQPAGTANVAANRSSLSVANATQLSGIGSRPLNQNNTVVCTYDTALYDFVGWFANDGVSNPAQALSTNPSYTFQVTGDTTLYYVLANKASGNVLISNGGAIGGDDADPHYSGFGEYAVGDSVTVEVTSYYDGVYIFNGWYNNPDGQPAHKVSSNLAYTFTASESITLYASFSSTM